MNTGDTVLVSQHNPAMSDIAQSLSNSLDRDGKGGMRAALQMGNNKITGLTPGENPTDAATVGQLTSGGGIPIGTMLDYWGATPPEDWLFAAGQEISRSTYSDLFDVIGTVGGTGNGSTTFNLPDCRGRAVAGKDDMGGTAANRLTASGSGVAGATLGASGGTETANLSIAQLPAHNHTGTTDAATTAGAGFVVNISSGFDAVTQVESEIHTHTFTTSNTGSGQSHLNTQPTIVCNKIIKVF